MTDPGTSSPVSSSASTAARGRSPSTRPLRSTGWRRLSAPSDFCSLAGKTALVTGGSRGIGAAIARELAQAGAAVTLSYHSSKDEAEQVAKESGARAMQADV